MKSTIKKTVCELNKCTGCKACVSVCKSNCITINDSIQYFNAVIDSNICVSCNRCKQICPVNSPVELHNQIYYKQGWNDNPVKRAKASSGGAATAIAESFIKNGGVVASCIYSKGRFIFDIIEDISGINKLYGSKYIKSDTDNVYEKIRIYIKKGKPVLFIGLPCQVAAIKNIASAEKFSEKLYTIDLICHGTPSPKLFQKYISENNIVNIKTIKFREKQKFELNINDNICSIEYLDAFLSGIDYTDNCYECRYARIDRVSDITLGDAWGSSLNKYEQNKGISLILCQSEKGINLLKKADLHLEGTDIEKEVDANEQLKHPSIKTWKNRLFFKCISLNYTFKRSVHMCYPDLYFKKWIKNIFIERVKH